MNILIFCFLLFPVILYAGQFDLFITGGPDFSRLNNTSFVRVSPQVTNRYDAQEKYNVEGFWGGGISFTLPIALPQTQFSFGLAAYSLYLGKVEGTEYPFINGGIFDTLTYQFAVQNTVLMIEPRILYSRDGWQPFFIAGIGEAWNHLKNYREIPSDPKLSATPMAASFSDQTHQNVAYELGVGIQHRLFEDNAHKMTYNASIGYRYFNLGRGKMGASIEPASLLNFGIKNIDTQSIAFQLNASFN